MTPRDMTKEASFVAAVSALRSSPLAGSVMLGSVLGVVSRFEKAASVPTEFSKREERNIKKTLRLLKPRTKSEEQVQQIAGRSPTTGQLIRRGVIGAGGGVAARILSGAITGAPLTIRAAMRGAPARLSLFPLRQIAARAPMPEATAKVLATLAPRGLLSSGTGGVVFGLGIPAIQRSADIEAARRGQF